MSLSEWKQLETVIFSDKITFITIRTIIEYMQLCQIHLYQKIARKKVARVNAAEWRAQKNERLFIGKKPSRDWLENDQWEKASLVYNL